jgi:hypothetical protein
MLLSFDILLGFMCGNNIRGTKHQQSCCTHLGRNNSANALNSFAIFSWYIKKSCCKGKEIKSNWNYREKKQVPSEGNFDGFMWCENGFALVDL